MFDARMFGDTNKLKQQWEDRKKELVKEWSSNPTKLNKKRIKAVEILSNSRRIADTEGRLDFKYAVLSQKIEHLDITKTSGEVDQILLEAKRGKTVQIPTNSFYWMIEEECLLWQQLSLEAPLASEGFDRYMKVFSAFCKKYDMENPICPEKDISGINILSVEEMRVARALLAKQQGIEDEGTDQSEENKKQIQLSLF